MRPRHTLYRQYSQTVWQSVREVVPTVEQTGHRRGLPRPRRDRAGLPRRAQARRGRPGGRPRCDLADLLARRRHRARSSPRSPPTGASRAGSPSCPPGRRRRSSRPFDVRLLPGVGPRAEERLRAAGIATIGDLAALDDDALRRLLPGKVGTLLRDRARGIDERGLETQVERISISTEETLRARHRRPRAAACRASADGRPARRAPRREGPGGPHGDDEGALPGLLDPQPLLYARRRSRRRRDDRRGRLRSARPGARRPARPLRLVGVGLSNIEDFRQLALS